MSAARQERARQAERQQEAKRQQEAERQDAAKRQSAAERKAKMDELRRRQEEEVLAAIKEHEESELKVLMKNEERVERLRMEYQKKEEKLIKEMEAKEVKMKLEFEEAMFQLASLKKERSQDLKREFKVADEQLGKENVEIEKRQKRKSEESLALLLDQNEVEFKKMMANQGEEEKERVARKRKVDQVETAATNQPAAPECPVFFENNFHFLNHRQPVSPEYLSLFKLLSTSYSSMSAIFFLKKNLHFFQNLLSFSEFFPPCRFALMRWCLPQGSSTVPMDTKSARLASILKLTKKMETNLLHFFTRSKMNQPMCPKCRKKIIGRATDMENFLKVGLSSKYHLCLHNRFPHRPFVIPLNLQELLPNSGRASKFS